MKKTLLILEMFLLLLGQTVYAQDVLKDFKDNLALNLARKNIKKEQIKVEKISDVKEIKGFILVRAEITLPNKKLSQFFLTNGEVVAQNFIQLATGTNILNKYMTLYFKDNFDFKKLTHLKGSGKEKNYLVEISDFQCPFCKKANAFLESKLAKAKDLDVYFLNYPLETHKKSFLLAKIFEAGLQLDKDFSSEIFSKDWSKKKDEEIVNYFAKLSGKEDKFKKLVNSKEIKNKILEQKELADKFGFTATPTFIYNGNIIRGLDLNRLNAIFK